MFKLLPLASCRAATLPFVFRVTALVPSTIHAFVEALGVPLVQLPLTPQDPLLSLQVVDGPLKVPHCARTCVAAMETDSVRVSRKGRARRAIPNECRRRMAE